MSRAKDGAIEYVNGEYWGADSRPLMRVRNPNDERCFLAGARALLALAKSKAQFMSDEDGEGVDAAVDIAELEAYFAEQAK